MGKEKKPERAECADCGKVFNVPANAVIPDLEQRTEPGGEVPACECPECGALSYLVKEKKGVVKEKKGAVREPEGSRQRFTREAFPWPGCVMWIGPQGFIPMDNNRVAVIELSEHGTHDHWEGLLVRVISNRTGEIDRKYFAFSEYLEKKDLAEGCLCVLGYCGWEWYIREPKTAAPIVDAVFLYLALFDPTFVVPGGVG